MQEQGLLPIRPGNPDLACQLLETTINEIATAYRDERAPAIDRVWLDAIAAITGDLREWLRRAADDDFGYVPQNFELSLGVSGRPERRQADQHPLTERRRPPMRYSAQGIHHLVERQAAGQIRVTDHKTEKFTGVPDQVIAVKIMTAPLLCASSRKALRRPRQSSRGVALFLHFRWQLVEQVVPLDNYARAAAVRVADTIGAALAQPFLPAAPDKNECNFCDYRVVCGRHEERRTGLKSKRSLEALLALRGSP